MRAELLAGLVAMREALSQGTPSVQPPLPPQMSPAAALCSADGRAGSKGCFGWQLGGEGAGGVLVAGGDGWPVLAEGAGSAAAASGDAGVQAAGGGAGTSSGSSSAGAGDALVRAPQRWRGFSALAGELVVGGVYVRVYNSTPGTLPADAPGFCKALVRWVGAHVSRCVHRWVGAHVSRWVHIWVGVEPEGEGGEKGVHGLLIVVSCVIYHPPRRSAP